MEIKRRVNLSWVLDRLRSGRVLVATQNEFEPPSSLDRALLLSLLDDGISNPSKVFAFWDASMTWIHLHAYGVNHKLQIEGCYA